MRPVNIVGNWKMNPGTVADSVALAEAVRAGVGAATDVRAVVCPPAVHLTAVDRALAGSPVGLGGQNMHWKADGAYTGETSAAMLVDAGCTHVLLGHSERRHGLGETDHQVNDKLHAALVAGLIPIVCVGETRDEREAGRTIGVVGGQLLASFAGVPAEKFAGVLIAYEPVWAIGTNLTASPDQAQEVHAYIRHLAADHYNQATADRIVVLYGGSVKPDNARKLIACPDIDGALVGGASLSAADFLTIIDEARAAMPGHTA